MAAVHRFHDGSSLLVELLPLGFTSTILWCVQTNRFTKASLSMVAKEDLFCNERV